MRIRCPRCNTHFQSGPCPKCTWMPRIATEWAENDECEETEKKDEPELSHGFWAGNWLLALTAFVFLLSGIVACYSVHAVVIESGLLLIAILPGVLALGTLWNRREGASEVLPPQPKISFQCTSCTKKYRVDCKKSGLRTKCLACGECLQVPARYPVGDKGWMDDEQGPRSIFDWCYRNPNLATAVGVSLTGFMVWMGVATVNSISTSVPDEPVLAHKAPLKSDSADENLLQSAKHAVAAGNHPAATRFLERYLSYPAATERNKATQLLKDLELVNSDQNAATFLKTLTGLELEFLRKEFPIFGNIPNRIETELNRVTDASLRGTYERTLCRNYTREKDRRIAEASPRMKKGRILMNAMVSEIQLLNKETRDRLVRGDRETLPLLAYAGLDPTNKEDEVVASYHSEREKLISDTISRLRRRSEEGMTFCKEILDDEQIPWEMWHEFSAEVGNINYRTELLLSQPFPPPDLSIFHAALEQVRQERVEKSKRAAEALTEYEKKLIATDDSARFYFQSAFFFLGRLMSVHQKKQLTEDSFQKEWDKLPLFAGREWRCFAAIREVVEVGGDWRMGHDPDFPSFAETFQQIRIISNYDAIEKQVLMLRRNQIPH